MGLPSIFLIALGLSMDAFAVSITSGSRTKARLLEQMLLIALFFGVFQALMPALGWLAGAGLSGLVSRFDHWIAFTLLGGLGGKMIYDAFGDKDDEDQTNEIEARTCRVMSRLRPSLPQPFQRLLGHFCCCSTHIGLCLLISLAIATSIDALIVGFSMSCLRTGILLPVTIIGLVTFVISAVGVWIGHQFGRILGSKCEFIGGLILVALGCKVLLLHLGAVGTRVAGL